MMMTIPITKGGMRVMRAAASCHQLSTAPRLRMIIMIIMMFFGLTCI